MAVADQRHVVVCVKERTARFVEEILPPAADDLEWVAVAEAEAGSEEFAAQVLCCLFRKIDDWETIFWDPDDQVRIRRVAQPHFSLAREAYAGKIALVIEQVGD